MTSTLMVVILLQQLRLLVTTTTTPQYVQICLAKLAQLVPVNQTVPLLAAPLTFTSWPSNVLPAVASKVCTENGEWGRHPESKRTWTNYTNCKANSANHQTVRWNHNDTRPSFKAIPERRCFMLQAAMTHFYLVIIGHALSLVSLLISLTIFFYFKWVSGISVSSKNRKDDKISNIIAIRLC